MERVTPTFGEGFSLHANGREGSIGEMEQECRLSIHSSYKALMLQLELYVTMSLILITTSRHHQPMMLGVTFATHQIWSARVDRVNHQDRVNHH